MQSSKDLYDEFCKSNKIIDLPEQKNNAGYADFINTKKRHTIVSRSAHFVESGEVDHINRPNTDAVTNIKSNFCFCPLPASQQVQMVVGSCFKCKGCRNLNRTNCRYLAYTGQVAIRNITRSGGTEVRTRSSYGAELKSQLQKTIVEGSNVTTLADGSAWVVAKATGKPVSYNHNIQDHDGGTIKAHTAVVHVHQYEPVMPTSADPYKKVYCLRTPSGTCTNRWSACGINRSAPDGGPCLKQHVQTYRLSHVRKPVNFEMAVPRANVSRRSSGAAAVTKHTYTIHPLARQQIKQNTSMLPLEEK